MASSRSVEPQIKDMVSSWLREYDLDFKLEQDSLNAEIDKALNEYFSKSGGKGGNRPDVKLLVRDSNIKDYPILIECKGHKDKLEKLNQEGIVDNRNDKNEPKQNNIKQYAVNGAVHYANALLHYTNYTDIIAIGITGWKDDLGQLQYKIGVYCVSKDNFGLGRRIDEYTDLSFLKDENFNGFINKINQSFLTEEERMRYREKREDEINAALTKLNNDIYKGESGISEQSRVYLVASVIMASLGVVNKVTPLEKSELISSSEFGNKDGDIVIRKIEAFLNEKNLPREKKDLIIRNLSNILLDDSINKPVSGESQLKRIFCKIIDDLGIYYKIGLNTDFTGKLFNEMHRWMHWSQDTLNDVVLTPPYVCTLMAKLARVNRDSYVWDFATGSAGLLIAAMNEMLTDANDNIKSPDELKAKINKIKCEQLLGIEKLSEIYMLAVLNMILMGDGSSNILHANSLENFDGNYGFCDEDKKFPADAFLLNPPYSEHGNGMIFVEKALAMMNKGYAAIIIQNTAGSGQAVDYNKAILKHSTLLASIKMPSDLFKGKSEVQTYIYVFKVGETHQKDDIVKFIDFSKDGYTRAARRNARNNLRDTDRAKERYSELVDLVRFGKGKLNIFTEKEYFEGHIDPENGADWNLSTPIALPPTEEDFKKTVADYLSWKVSQLMKGAM